MTGGSRGIGAACCGLLARAGASVAVHYRREKAAAEAVLAALVGAEASGHLRCGADLGDPAGVDALFDRVEAEWGSLDCLVNNAGIWVRNPLASFDREALEQTWQVNVRAPFLCMARALPLLERSDHASVVNLTSTAAQRGEARYSPYAASKGALVAATRSWASELAPGIRVNAVAPGWVDTDMSAAALAGPEGERIVAGIPLGRAASAEDIAGAVLFLVSPLARHLTGSVVSVNGGAVLAG